MNRPVLPALEPLERALRDHHAGLRPARLTVRYDTGEVDTIDAALFFREPEGEVEQAALDACEGRVLDVGASAGAATLALQSRGHVVTALDVLPGAVAVLRERGGRDVRCADVWTADLDARYDTVLALMNGTGLAGTGSRLPALLERLASFVAPGGRILLDSADVRPEASGRLPDGRYAGELHIQLEYDGSRGAPFPHLYAHEGLLARSAREVGLRCEVLVRDGDGRYLARLIR